LEDDLDIAMQTGELTVEADEREALREIVESQTGDLITPRIAGKERVAKGFYFEPFDWYIVVSEERDTFYSQVNQITQRTGIILIVAIILGVVMVLIFAGYLTNPLTRVVQAMEKIISTNDMSSRVEVEYNDETGKLAHTFNIMVGALETAYKQIKKYALGAAVAQKKEHKIRTMFQKFVPADVIDQFFANPEKMLVGENRVISILFSDIRSFTSISEQLEPDDLVSSLNRYFTVMVDIIDARQGTIDKYIGDAIMAFFGAPARHKDDALNSVLAGIEMTEALEEFNANQRRLDKPEFRIGVGINYGVVTVGNIGTDKKMDYTIIGDMVNLGSRLEGLTKKYKQPLLISESLYRKVHEQIPCRLIDTVAVKGRKKGVRIYAAKKTLTEAENKAWTLHNTAMDHYYQREFDQAIRYFQDVRKIFPDDYASELMIDHCQQFKATPPPPDWDGVEIMKEK
jgi:class 3 adenylate cyclase/HAMP domain-containing protein